MVEKIVSIDIDMVNLSRISSLDPGNIQKNKGLFLGRRRLKGAVTQFSESFERSPYCKGSWAGPARIRDPQDLSVVPRGEKEEKTSRHASLSHSIKSSRVQVSKGHF